MRFERFKNDESAVSPVIGVILMVAITVILAAVIASFVLGLSPGTATTPTASFSSEASVSGGSGTVTITMGSGQDLTVGDLSVKGNNLANTGGLETLPQNSFTTTSVLTAGTSFKVDVNANDWKINLIYSNGDTSSTMQTFED